MLFLLIIIYNNIPTLFMKTRSWKEAISVLAHRCIYVNIHLYIYLISQLWVNAIYKFNKQNEVSPGNYYFFSPEIQNLNHHNIRISFWNVVTINCYYHKWLLLHDCVNHLKSLFFRMRSIGAIILFLFWL